MIPWHNMLHRIFIGIQILFLALYFSRISFFTDRQVLGASVYESTQDNEEDIEKEISFPKVAYRLDISTQTAFDQKEVTEHEPILFETEYIDDEDFEYGLERVEQVGVNGVETTTYLVTFWVDEELDRLLLSTEVENSITEIIALGKKIVWHRLDTPEYGKIKYWRKMTVWATKYDSTCEGCNNTTALGAPVQQGVCAVDPSVISMYTHFYVPGYGKCQALDVGGAIKGNKIDLAYEDAWEGSWRTGYTDIYLMDNEPE